MKAGGKESKLKAKASSTGLKSFSLLAVSGDALVSTTAEPQDGILTFAFSVVANVVSVSASVMVQVTLNAIMGLL